MLYIVVSPIKGEITVLGRGFCCSTAFLVCRFCLSTAVLRQMFFIEVLTLGDGSCVALLV